MCFLFSPCRPMIKRKIKQKFQEFFEMPTDYLGIYRMKFIGEGLDEEYDMTLEELINTGKDDTYDDEMVSKYLKTIKKQRDQQLINSYAQLAEVENNKSKGPLSKEWIALKRQLFLMPYTCYVFDVLLFR